VFVDQSWDNLKFPTTLMTFAEPSAKRVRLQVIDVFHGIEESGGSAAEGGSPARIGFFLGDEEEHLFLQIEDCPVTAIARAAPPQGVEGGETNHAGGSGRGPVLPPADYHLGDTLDVCHAQASKAADVHIDFDYLASQMTQAPTQDPKLCIQNLVKQGSTPIGRWPEGGGRKGASQPGQSRGQAPAEVSPPRSPPPPRGLMPSYASPMVPSDPCACPHEPPSAGGSIFQTGSGVAIPVDPQRIAAANRLLDGASPTMRPAGGSIFSTGAGKTLAIDPEKVAAQRLLLAGEQTGTPKGLPSAVPAPPASSGSIFSTGAGMSITIDPAKLAASRKLLGEEGGRGHCASADRAALAATRPGPVDRSGGSIFQTGAGSSIKISREKVDAAKARLEDAGGSDPSEHRKASTPMMSRFAPNRMDTSKVSMPNPFNAVAKPFSISTPGHDLLRRPRSSGPVCIKTPRMVTPQNAFGGGFNGGNTVTPSSSLAGSVNRPVALRASMSRSQPTPNLLGQLARRDGSEHAQFSRTSLPITPGMASKFAFSDMYGPGDVRAHLLSTGAVPEIVSDAWVRNHYKWVVWKLAMAELYAEMRGQAKSDLDGREHDDGHRLGSRLHYDAVKEELSARYNREYVEGKRSFLKGVLQRDYPFGVPCVLKVASIAVNAGRSTCTLQLTDGWYGMYAECDKQLLALAQSKKLFIGQKLRICGGELSGGSPGDPLEVADETRIILSYNQVHPVAHGTKLGAQPGRQPITPLSFIDDKGGRVPKTIVSVLRMFPRMVWSKLPSGVSTFQTTSKAGKAEACLEIELERIYSQVKNEIDKEDLVTCKSWIQEGKAGGIKHVERLYAEMVVRGDNQFGENLNTQDRIDLEAFILERRGEMEQERRDRVRDVLGAECPAAGGAKTTPCQTMLVGEVSKKKIFKRPMEYLGPDDYPSMALLTVWNCEGVREGDVISVSSLESFDRFISSQAHQGPFLNALKHLVTTKTSEIQVLSADSVPPEHVVVAGSPASRIMTTQGLLHDKERGICIPNLFDVDAIVVLTSPVLLEDCLHRQWAFAIDYVEEDDGEAHPWVLAIKLSGPQDAIQWFEEHSGSFVSHFGNVSLRGYDAEQRFVQLQGSMGTELRADVANGPHLNEILVQNEDLLASLKTRLMSLLGVVNAPDKEASG
jgi:hypothetical protein